MRTSGSKAALERKQLLVSLSIPKFVRACRNADELRNRDTRWIANTTVLAAAMLVTSCAVGPDFLHPAAPEITRYSREPLTHTASTDVASGQRQVFMPGRDIPEQWWGLFRSPRLNALIDQALHNNQNLQSALASLRAAKEAVYAQEGKFFPLAQA